MEFLNTKLGSLQACLDDSGRPVFNLNDIVKIADIKAPTNYKTMYGRGNMVIIHNIKFITRDYVEFLLNYERKPNDVLLAWMDSEIIPVLLGQRELSFADIMASKSTAEWLIKEYQDLKLKMAIVQKSVAETVEAREYVKRSLDSNSLKDLYDVASILCISGIDTPEILSVLRNSGVLDSENMPLQEYVDKGWFRVDTHSYQDKTAGTVIHKRVFCYKLGINQIRKLLDKFAGGK